MSIQQAKHKHSTFYIQYMFWLHVYNDRHTLTLIIEVLVEGIQPVLQLISGLCAEDDGLRSLW